MKVRIKATGEVKEVAWVKTKEACGFREGFLPSAVEFLPEEGEIKTSETMMFNEKCYVNVEPGVKTLIICQGTNFLELDISESLHKEQKEECPAGCHCALHATLPPELVSEPLHQGQTIEEMKRLDPFDSYGNKEMLWSKLNELIRAFNREVRNKKI